MKASQGAVAMMAAAILTVGGAGFSVAQFLSQVPAVPVPAAPPAELVALSAPSPPPVSEPAPIAVERRAVVNPLRPPTPQRRPSAPVATSSGRDRDAPPAYTRPTEEIRTSDSSGRRNPLTVDLRRGPCADRSGIRIMQAYGWPDPCDPGGSRFAGCRADRGPGPWWNLPGLSRACSGSGDGCRPPFSSVGFRAVAGRCGGPVFFAPWPLRDVGFCGGVAYRPQRSGPASCGGQWFVPVVWPGHRPWPPREVGRNPFICFGPICALSSGAGVPRPWLAAARSSPLAPEVVVAPVPDRSPTSTRPESPTDGGAAADVPPGQEEARSVVDPIEAPLPVPGQPVPGEPVPGEPVPNPVPVPDQPLPPAPVPAPPPVPDPAVEPVPEPAPDPPPAPVPDPQVPVQDPPPAPVPDPQPDPVPDRQPDPEPAPEPAPDPQPEPAPQPKAPVLENDEQVEAS